MSDHSHDPNQMTGAAMIVRALIDHGVQHIFEIGRASCRERVSPYV